MSVWNKIAAIALLGGVLTAPAFADGVPGQQVNRGPAPLKAHAMTPPEPGCVLIEGNKWSCPVPAARFTHAPAATRTTRAVPTRTYAARPATRSYSTSTRTQAPAQRTYTTSTRTHAPVQRTYTTTTRTQAPTVTRRATSSTRTYASTSRSVAVRPQQMTVDISGFSGGVGAGLGGEPVFGGGTVFFGGDKRYSGVLSHGASAFTFQQRSTGGGGHKPPHKPRHHPKPKPCGGCH